MPNADGELLKRLDSLQLGAARLVESEPKRASRVFSLSERARSSIRGGHEYMAEALVLKAERIIAGIEAV